MDGSIILGVEGSGGKAVASVIFGQPSGELEARADRPTFRAILLQYGGKFIMGQGAVPISRDGQIAGACGVGGGTPQEDEDCARAGIAGHRRPVALTHTRRGALLYNAGERFPRLIRLPGGNDAMTTGIVLSQIEYDVVGKTPIRHDGYDKVTGKANYGADISLPGLLHGKILRSPHAHANVLSIDTSRAEAHPDVKAVVTACDLACADGWDLGDRHLSNKILATGKVVVQGPPGSRRGRDDAARRRGGALPHRCRIRGAARPHGTPRRR